MTHVYVLGQEDGAGPLKFGFSGSRSGVTRRLESVQTGNPHKLRIVHFEDLTEIEAATGRSARHYEAAVKTLLAEWRLRGEWFSRTPDTLSFMSLWAKFGLAKAIIMFPERFVQKRQEAKAIARKAKRRRARSKAAAKAGRPYELRIGAAQS